MEAERLMIRVTADASQYMLAIAAVESRLLAFGTTATAMIAGHAMKMAADLESVAVAFEVITGSAEEAKGMIQSLQNFGVATPFSQAGVMREAQSLAAYGVEAKNILPVLKSIGDVTAGVGGGEDKFARIAYAFGEVLNNERIFSTEMRQFASAGIPMWAAVADVLGVTVREARLMAKEGELGSDVMIKAFNKLTQEGGRFHDMMSRQSDTTRGRWNSLSETVGLGLTGIGTGINQGLKDSGFFAITQSWAEDFRKQGESIGAAIAGGIEQAMPAVASMQAAFQTMGSWFGSDKIGSAMEVVEAIGSIPAIMETAGRGFRAVIFATLSGFAKLADWGAQLAGGGGEGSVTHNLHQEFQGQALQDLDALGLGDPSKRDGGPWQRYWDNVEKNKKKLQDLKNDANHAKAALTGIGDIPIKASAFDTFGTKFIDAMKGDYKDFFFGGGGSGGGSSGSLDVFNRKMQTLTQASTYSDSELKIMKTMRERNRDLAHWKDEDLLKYLSPSTMSKSQLALLGMTPADLKDKSPALDPAQAKFAAGKLLDELRKGGIKASFPPGAERGSAEAQDIVNRSIYGRAMSVQEEIKTLLEQWKDAQERRAAEEVEALKGIKLVVKGGRI